MHSGRRRATALTAVAFSLLLGCGRGPDEAALRQEIERRLDQHFAAELFRLRSLRRMGSAPFRADGTGEVGRFVYYRAELEFERDYSLTAWKGLNLGTLAFVLGATESGVTGFRARGNVAGDVLRVHGRLSYHEVDGRWLPADDAPPPGPAAASAVQDVRGSGPDALLRGVRDLLARSPETERGSRDAVVIRELRRAVSRIDFELARLDGKLTIGAGPAPGTYHAFGAALSSFAARRDLPMYSYESEGSVENGSRIQARTLDLGLVQSDVAERLYQGRVEEGVLPNRDLRAVASLWPEAVHLVTLDGKGIRALGDLRSRRVAIGKRGSGSRFNAVQISLAAGIEASEVPDVRELGLVDGIAALERDEIDALFVTEAIPSRALQALAARRSDVRFVSIDRAVVRTLSDEHFAYYPLAVEARTYPAQETPFETLGLACTLMTNRHVSDAAITRALELLVDEADDLSQRYFRAAFVSRETMRLGIAVPLHPAAERFYADREARRAAATQAAPGDATLSPR